MTQSVRRRIRHASFATVGLGLLAIFAPKLSIMQRFETASLDWRYRNFNRTAPASESVVVVDIDEASLKILAPHFGRWPWPRRVYKELLTFLGIGEPRAILFDVLYTERMLGTDDDKEFFETGLGLGNVSHGINLLEERADGETGMGIFPKGFPEKYAIPGAGLDQFPQPIRYYDAVVHAEEMIPYLNELHVATFREDSDGVFRRAPMLFQIKNSWLPSLALAALKVSQTAKLSYDGGLKIADGANNFYVPMDASGLMPIHYYRPGREPKSVPIAAVFDSARHLQMGEELEPNAVSPFEFKDKIVIVGASAVGLSDLKITPIRSAYPGALVQATAVSNLLQGDYLSRLPGWGLSLIALVITLISYGAILFIESFPIKIGISLVVSALYTGLSLWLFKERSYDVGLATALTVSAVGIVEALIYLGVVEGKEKRRMQSTLSKYLSPEVTKRLIETGQDPHAEDGRQQEITILFTDIRSFTTISEAHEAPVVVHHLNNYLGKMTEIIFEETGTLDKFVGDAIMAFWGAPLANPDHAFLAVRCALTMQRAVEEMRRAIGEDSPFAFKTGIGINTGNVVVGNIGSSKRLDYTVIGDNVNLAARIESVTKDFRSPILIGESTYRAVKDKVVCRLIDEHVQIKGKKEYIKLFQPLSERSSSDAMRFEEVASEFENALAIYRVGNFAVAQKQFSKLNLKLGSTDGPSQLFIERCQIKIDHPPTQWSGYDDQKASGH